MSRDYCINRCKLGRDKSREFLDASNSAYDAAFDFSSFVEECRKTCPHIIQLQENANEIER